MHADGLGELGSKVPPKIAILGISDPYLSASQNKEVAKEFQNQSNQMQLAKQVTRDPQKVKSCSYPIPQAQLFRPLAT